MFAPSVSSWNEVSRKCSNLYSSVSYTVYYAKMGFTGNPQNYVVDVVKGGETQDWTYTKSVTSES